MTFSWSLPALTLCNGVITGYSLSCVPEVGTRGRNTISMQYTAAGTFTRGGFTLAISYNCSISADNSQGSGPLMHRVVTTPDDGKYGEEEQCNITMIHIHVSSSFVYLYIILLFSAILFQLQLSSFPACHEWVVSPKLFTASTAWIFNSEIIHCRAVIPVLN